MKASHNRLGRRGTPALVLAALATTVLAACSSNSSTAASSTPAASDAPSVSSDASAAPASGDAACTPVDPANLKVLVGVGALASPYFQDVITGVKTMATDLGLTDDQVVVYESGFDGQKLVNDLTAALASDEGDAIILADPASPAFTKPLVDLAALNGARLVTWWNRPADIHPWDTGDGAWIANQSFDMVKTSKAVSEALFATFGNKGGVVALGGVPDNPTAKDRLAGLEAALAENPDVVLLDSQPGNWQQTVAQDLTTQFLAKFGDELSGVWAANDSMGLGSLEALRAEGKNGQILSTGMDGTKDVFDALKAGDLAAVGSYDGVYQGAQSLALAYAAAACDVIPADLTNEQRDYYLKTALVTKDNVDQFLAPRDLSALTYEALKADFWANVDGAVRDEG